MGVQELRPPHGETDPELLLEALGHLCVIVDESPTEPEMLQLGLDALRTALGDRVAIDLRDGSGVSPDDTTRHLPLVGDGMVHGALHLPDPGREDRTAVAFATAAARVLGMGLARHRKAAERPGLRAGSARSLTQAAHRMRGATATIGVATSAMRLRGEHIDAEVRERLHDDIDESVQILRDAVDDLLSAIGQEGPGDG
jgi:hypothetical protein